MTARRPLTVAQASRRLLIACALMTVTAGAPLGAADEPSRLFRGLFGPDPDVALTSHPIVELRVSTYEARGQTVERAGEGLDEASLHGGQFYSGITTGLSYRRKTRNATLNAGFGNALRLYELTGVTTTEHSGYGSMELRASRRTVVRAATGVLYTPFHQILGLPISTDTASGSDAAVATDASTTLTGGASVTRQMGRRGLLTAGYDGRVTAYTSGQQGPVSHQAGAAYSYEFARGIALRLGDGVRMLKAGAGDRIVAQDIALGIDVNRSLTASRRTSVTFTTGSSITSNESGHQLVATGSATFAHRIGQTWQTAVTFDRGLQVADLLPKPFIGNSTGFTLGGFLGRRASMRLRGSYAFGDFDLNGSSSRYVSYIAEARGAIALGRHFQLYAEHLYYQHRFPDGTPLPADVPFRRVQHGTRFGLEIWTPLMGKP
jgi:hypothetical protein